METRGDGGCLAVERTPFRLRPSSERERVWDEDVWLANEQWARCLRANGHAIGHLKRFLDTGNSQEVVMALGYLESTR